MLLHGGHSGTLRDAARMAGAASRVVEVHLRFPTEDQTWKILEASILRMAPNEWMGPVQVPKGWIVMQVLDKDQGAQTFENLPPVIKQNLTNEALMIERDQLLTRFTDSLRTVVRPLEIHPERLKQVPWPSPTSLPAGARADGS
jgi:hypothetical protein